MAVRCKRKRLIELEREENMGKGKGERFNGSELS
jgi:hypothetical protein